MQLTQIMFSLVRYVRERPWWPIQSPDKEGRKKKVKGQVEREIRSNLLILDFKDGKFLRFRKGRRRQEDP